MVGTEPFDRRAGIQQRFSQGDLHSGIRRVTARYQHAQRRILPTVHFRQCIDFGTGVEQGLGNLDSILRSLLAISLDAVGGDIVEKRGAMPGRIEMRDPR